MSDIITGMRQVIQDLVAPELKAHSVKLDALQKQGEMQQKQIEVLHDVTMRSIDAFRAEMKSEFALLRANNQMDIMRQVSPISERISVVEAKTKVG